MYYNLSGIFYRLWAVAGILFVLAVIILCFCKIWSKKRDKKGSIVGVVLLLAAIGAGGWYTHAAISPTIQSFDGCFVRQYRDSRVAPPLPFTMAYVFSDGTDQNLTFYLDSFSEDDIIMEEFQKDSWYRICYEDTLNIILRVEIITPG